MKLLKELMQESKTEKPPKDMFETGSAQAIVGWIRSIHNDEESAVSTLNFWIMKQGKDIPSNRVKALEFARELLAKEFKNEAK